MKHILSDEEFKNLVPKEELEKAREVISQKCYALDSISGWQDALLPEGYKRLLSTVRQNANGDSALMVNELFTNKRCHICGKKIDTTTRNGMNLFHTLDGVSFRVNDEECTLEFTRLDMPPYLCWCCITYITERAYNKRGSI